MSDWKTYKLGDIAELRKEQVAPNGKEQPYIGLEHIEQQTLRLTGIGSSTDVLSNKFKFYSGDILYGKLRPYFRKVYHPKFEGVCSTDIYVIKNKENIDKSFLYYLVATEDFTRIAYSGSTGTHMPRADWNQLVETEWNVPETIDEQQCIASILSSLDDKIELNRQTNQTLETIAQTLFQEICVPKVEELPEGWKIGKLRDVVEINPKLSLRKGSISKYIEMKDLSENSMIIKRCIDREFASGSKFQNGDTLLARITPCLENGKTGMVNLLDGDEVGWGSTEFIVLREKKGLGKYFVYCLARTKTFREYAIQSMVGSSGRQRVVESILADFDLDIPTESILDDFHNTVKPMFVQIFSLEQENQTLIALRDSLLPKLMTGEIEI